MWLSRKDVPYRLAAMGVLNQLLLDGMPTLLWGLLVHNIKVAGLLHILGPRWAPWKVSLNLSSLVLVDIRRWFPHKAFLFSSPFLILCPLFFLYSAVTFLL